MQRVRASLPVAPFREQVLRAVEENQVVIVSGV